MILESNERVNRTALLLAKERYDAQLGAFIAKKPERIEYVRADIARIVTECANEVGADVEYVRSRFADYLASMPKQEPKHVELSVGDGNYAENTEGRPELAGVVEDDVLNHDGVLVEEAIKPDESYDLGKDTQRGFSGEKASCFRCHKQAATNDSPICVECNDEIVSLAIAYNPQNLGVQPDANAMSQCTECGYKGTYADVAKHVQESHPQLLQQEQLQQQTQQPFTSGTKEADLGADPTTDPGSEPDAPPQAQPDEISKEDPVEVGNSTEPADLFDSMVSELANRAAAKQFSLPTEDEIQAIAQQYSLDPETVKANLMVVAHFGDFSAVNGQLNESDEVGDDKTELQFGGKVDAHEALVPTDLVVKNVASETNSTPELVYSQVRDRYGADLSDKYHTSVTGQHRFYLPASMVQASSPAEEPQPYDPKVGPTPQPTDQQQQV